MALELRERPAVFETVIFPPAPAVDELSSESSCPESLTLIVLPVALVDEVTLPLTLVVPLDEGELAAALNTGAFDSGWGLLAPLPANVPVVEPFPPNPA